MVRVTAKPQSLASWIEDVPWLPVVVLDESGPIKLSAPMRGVTAAIDDPRIEKMPD